MNLKTAIEQFFTDTKDVFKVIAPAMAFIGIIGLGILYVGAPLPVVSKFKRDNPDAFTSVTLGMVFLLAAGTLSSLIVFS